MRIRGEGRRNGEAQTSETDQVLRSLSRDDADLALLRSLGMARWWTVRLTWRKRTLGSMSLALSAQRAFDEADRRLVELIASRMALALDVATVRARAGDAVGELDAILAGLADAVTVQDRGGRLVYANQAAAELLGYESPAELLAAGGAVAAARFESFREDGRKLDMDELPARRLFAGEADPSPVLIRAVRLSMDGGPAEMNSLYGSMARSAVISLLNSRCAMILAPTRTAPVWPPIPRIVARRICLVSGSDPEFRRRGATPPRRAGRRQSAG